MTTTTPCPRCGQPVLYARLTANAIITQRRIALNPKPTPNGPILVTYTRDETGPLAHNTPPTPTDTINLEVPAPWIYLTRHPHETDHLVNLIRPILHNLDAALVTTRHPYSPPPASIP